MANIDISSNKLEEATSYLIQYLRDSGFEGSTEAGTAIYDVLIRPSAMLYALFNDMVNRAKAYNSIAEANNVRTLIGEDEYNAAIDSILQNWFVTRKEGSKSTGTIRLYFTRLLTFFELKKDGTAKVNINGVDYDVARDYALSSSNFSSIYNSERNAIEYYTDLEIESIANAVGTAGDIVGYINSIYLIRLALVGDIVSGSEFETSEEFIARTNQAITTRELISDNSIYTTLGEVFTGIRELYIAGFGDTEQLRDVVTFESIDIHVGNKADIYLNIDLEPTEVVCPVSSIGNVDLTSITQHIADVSKISHRLKVDGVVRLHCLNTPPATVSLPLGTVFTPVDDTGVIYSAKSAYSILTTDWLDCYEPGLTGVYYDVVLTSDLFTDLDSVEYIEKDTVFQVPNILTMVADVKVVSTFDHTSIPFVMSAASIFDIGTVGEQPVCTTTAYVNEITSCIVTYLGNTTYLDVWNYVTDYSNRVVCYDPKVKSKFIIYINCNVIVSTTGLSTVAEIEAEQELCKSAIIAYVNGLTKDDVYSVYDMLVAINTTCTHVDRVKVPATVTYRFQDPESLIYYTGTITDYFSLDDIVLGQGESLSLMVSQNTFQYYTDTDRVSVAIDKVFY